MKPNLPTTTGSDEENCVALSGTKQPAPRSSMDFAIEFGGYLANTVDGFMHYLNEHQIEVDTDQWQALGSAIYEFRKRATKAIEETTPVALANESATQFSPLPSGGWQPREEEIARIIVQSAREMHDDLGAKMYEADDFARTYYAGFNIAELGRRAARAVCSLLPPWRDIETAPKDGTWVQLWRGPSLTGSWANPVAAKWHEFDGISAWMWPCDPYDAITEYGQERANRAIDNGDYYEAESKKFTHWMPLSAAPQFKG